MDYQVAAPPQHLKGFVHSFWMYQENTEQETPAVAFRIIPDGRPGIIIDCSDRGAIHRDADGTRLPDAFIYGQSTRSLNNYSQGRINTFGVCLSPLALPALLAAPAAELTDRQIDLKLVQPGIAEQVRCAPNFNKRMEIVSSYLSRRLCFGGVRAELMALVSQILAERGRLALSLEYRRFHVSERQLVRRFIHQVGLTPKHFARIVRFQAALDRLRNGSYTLLSDIAFDLSYSDQSHFIRDFKRFCGLTPAEYAVRCREVIQNYPKLL
ncbi:hypothetical protein CAI21_18950 [Alkalilimnicola ehrlichii]|uniref:HTH araC/xylS-type domain-containing protein n=1 Tax=Alkalilimnicola ehrlichii TaxID=351052 RepID=A0A3E0WI22_9GAMM|nr:helix-turn-helix domain-containing protein [Alkalilimnicola ehrlichii]RFA25516.1 hypothetical protein CAI21_18950 [Alkalilimnicola ehrlichii]RFA32630.1 hypothetical protein CAL65_19365 [Alkalilimnicola ehrlichii]